MYCKEHDGEIEIHPLELLIDNENEPCPKCATNKKFIKINNRLGMAGGHPVHPISVYQNKDTILYLIEFDNGNHKIGLTKTNVETRFKHDIKNGVNIKLIKQWEFPKTGQLAYTAEKRILQQTANWCLTDPEQAILQGGNSEIRTVNILDCAEEVVKTVWKQYNPGDAIF